MTRWLQFVLMALVVFVAASCKPGTEPANEGQEDASPSVDAAADSAGSGEAPAEPEPERESLADYIARFEVDAAPPPPAPDPSEAGACPEGGKRDRDLGILVSPKRPAKGETVRVVVATLDSEAPLALRVEHEDSGEVIELDARYRTGVPAATVATFVAGQNGRHRIIVGREGEGLRCRSFAVWEHGKDDESIVDLSQVWPIERDWNAAEEALYSAWIRELFTGPADQDLAWKALSEVTSDASRNLLHNHLGRNEDDPSTGLKLVPDCADTPYFLRAYWSFKRGLAFGFRKCSRGKRGPPSCFDLRTNLDPPDRRPHWIDPPSDDTGEPDPSASLDGEPEVVPDNAEVPTPNQKIAYFFQRSIGWSVHTGNGRCAFGDSSSDLYPLELERRALRPGTVYADPYGHILVLAELVAPRGSQPGILFAVDGQPDGSITRKRFWEGNFLWNQSEPKLGGSGFKAFRPLMRVDDGDTYLQMDDETLAGLRDYGDVSAMQRELDGLAFYDLMERLITPGTRSPFAAQA